MAQGGDSPPDDTPPPCPVLPGLEPQTYFLPGGVVERVTRGQGLAVEMLREAWARGEPNINTYHLGSLIRRLNELYAKATWQRVLCRESSGKGGRHNVTVFRLRHPA